MDIFISFISFLDRWENLFILVLYFFFIQFLYKVVVRSIAHYTSWTSFSPFSFSLHSCLPPCSLFSMYTFFTSSHEINMFQTSREIRILYVVKEERPSTSRTISKRRNLVRLLQNIMLMEVRVIWGV